MNRVVINGACLFFSPRFKIKIQRTAYRKGHSMTRKDYRATATILTIFKGEMSEEAYALLVDKFAFMFQVDNSRFNRDKFRNACEVA